jgi:S-adenosylmethionine hydrolase
VSVTDVGRGAVFLLTDYGNRDEFAGVTRAVVLDRAPDAILVDLTHEVPAFDVRAGALTLARCVGSLGPGVVLAVVDPGVGSGRRAVAVAVGGASVRSTARRAGPRYLVGPDNGLLGWAIDALGGATAAVALTPPSGPAGPTFDGRDLFAPVAARLWGGATMNDVGVPIDPGTLVRLADPVLRVTAGGPLEAEVLWVDGFGNVQLAAREADGDVAGLHGALEIVVAGSPHGGRRVANFDVLGTDELGLLVDANGRLALVCRRRPAATVLGVEPRDMVMVRPVSGPGR